MMQCRRRCVSLQIDNLENRAVRLLDFSLTNGILIFRKSVWSVSAPTINGVTGSSCRSLPPEETKWLCQLYFKWRRASGPWAGKGWGRLRVTVLRASECNGSSREDGAINNSLTERGFVTAPTLRSPGTNFCIKSKNKSASPMKRRPINPNPTENCGS